jgi:uncharacterized membrane protein
VQALVMMVLAVLQGSQQMRHRHPRTQQMDRHGVLLLLLAVLRVLLLAAALRCC